MMTFERILVLYHSGRFKRN